MYTWSISVSPHKLLNLTEDLNPCETVAFGQEYRSARDNHRAIAFYLSALFM